MHGASRSWHFYPRMCKYREDVVIFISAINLKSTNEYIVFANISMYYYFHYIVTFFFCYTARLVVTIYDPPLACYIS
jgi:hypothetical protein